MIRNYKQIAKNIMKNGPLKINPKGALAFAACAIITVGGFKIGTDNYKRINITPGFDNTGIHVDAGKDFNIEKLGEDSKFVMFESTGWQNGRDDVLANNVKKCNDNNIPCGIIVKSNSKSVVQAQADASVIMSTIEEGKIDCPIYYDITEYDSSDKQQMVDIYNGFSKQLESIDNTITSGILVDNDMIYTIQDTSLEDATKLYVSEEKDLLYNNNTSMVYSTRTDTYYTPYVYGLNMINEEQLEEKKNIKGIDVSYAQGNIDWDKAKEQGVEYAFIRLNTFEFYHNDGSMHIDEYLSKNVEGCEKNGIPYGFYTYNFAQNVEQAKTEATLIADLLDTHKDRFNPTLPIYADIESNFLKNHPREAADICEVFCKTLDERGYTNNSVYASRDLLVEMCESNSFINELPNKWVALYHDNSTGHFTDITEDRIGNLKNIPNVGMVQVTENGQLDGVDNGYTNRTTGHVDVNIDITGMTRVNDNYKKA